MTNEIYLGRWVRGFLAATVMTTALVACGDNQPTGSGLSTQQGAANGTTAGATAVAAARHRILRPLSPLSGSYTTSRQPIFRWTPDVSATVQICDDRACGHVFTEISGQGSAQPDAPLRAGVVFWRVMQGKTTTAVWQLTIPGRDSGQFTAWGVTPDFNGDGMADVAIGAPASGSGSVSVFEGSTGLSYPYGAIVEVSELDQFGRAVAAAGDVNGDGFVDLAVAAADGAGSVTVYLGGANGPTANNGPPTGLPGGTVLLPGGVTSGFGTTIASAGDVNGDGYGDLLVGGVEIAQIFFGGPNGIATVSGLSLAGATDRGLDATVVQGPSDVNADGAPDLYVGGLLYLSSPSGLAAQSGVLQNFSTVGSFAGDENGDGFGDFAVYTVDPGTAAGLDPLNDLLAQAGEFAFETAGDLDGDGYTDVIFSISTFIGVPELERAYFGAPGSCGTNGCRRFSAITIPGHDNVGGNLTAFIAAAGDINGDGLDDLVASTPDTGMVYVFESGGATGMPIAFPFPTFTGPAGFGTGLPSLFGSTLAALPSL